MSTHIDVPVEDRNRLVSAVYDLTLRPHNLSLLNRPGRSRPRPLRARSKVVVEALTSDASGLPALLGLPPRQTLAEVQETLAALVWQWLGAMSASDGSAVHAHLWGYDDEAGRLLAERLLRPGEQLPSGWPQAVWAQLGVSSAEGAAGLLGRYARHHPAVVNAPQGEGAAALTRAERLVLDLQSQGFDAVSSAQHLRVPRFVIGLLEHEIQGKLRATSMSAAIVAYEVAVAKGRVEPVLRSARANAVASMLFQELIDVREQSPAYRRVAGGLQLRARMRQTTSEELITELDRLPPRWRRILPYTLAGEADADIAEMVGSTEASVQSMSSDMYERLQVHGTYGLAATVARYAPDHPALPRVPLPDRAPNLSVDQRLLLDLRSDGWSKRQIAVRLGMSMSELNSELALAFAELGAGSHDLIAVITYQRLVAAGVVESVLLPLSATPGARFAGSDARTAERLAGRDSADSAAESFRWRLQHLEPELREFLPLPFSRRSKRQLERAGVMTRSAFDWKLQHLCGSLGAKNRQHLAALIGFYAPGVLPARPRAGINTDRLTERYRLDLDLLGMGMSRRRANETVRRLVRNAPGGVSLNHDCEAIFDILSVNNVHDALLVYQGLVRDGVVQSVLGPPTLNPSAQAGVKADPALVAAVLMPDPARWSPPVPRTAAAGSVGTRTAL